MKKIYFTLTTLFITALSFGQSVFINEIHYDNAGGDVNEGFEISGPAGTDLTTDTYTVELYNGSGGAVYNIITLTGIFVDQQNGMGTIWFGLPANGMQNGAPDGLALIKAGVVVQFLSYEGVVTATAGVANGTSSTDIGVAESNSGTDLSLQLVGTGNNYTDFTWLTPIIATRGTINTGQVLAVQRNEIENFAVYPNPVVDGRLTITTMSNAAKAIQIFDVLGKQVFTTDIHQNGAINVESLNTGVYILKVVEEGKTSTSRLLIE
ncbi:MAG: T9SS type A sorting domain-containing protein [Flavobacteriaceae bacterium]